LNNPHVAERLTVPDLLVHRVCCSGTTVEKNPDNQGLKNARQHLGKNREKRSEAIHRNGYFVSLPGLVI